MGDDVRIQVNSDRNVGVDFDVSAYVKGEVTRVLSRFTTRLTRVEVHLGDATRHRFGARDRRCLIEVRPANHRPLTTSAAAAAIEDALGEALAKMRRALQRFFGRLGTPAVHGVSDSKRVGMRRAPTARHANSPRKRRTHLARRKSQPAVVSGRRHARR